MLLVFTSCKEEEQCFICDVEKADLVVLSSGIYVRWEYWDQETFCDGIPHSDPLPREMDDKFFAARRYTNCIPY